MVTAPAEMPATRVRTPVVSVIVPAHNAAAGLSALLEALGKQTVDAADMETILVDDDSSDRTADLATELLEQGPLGKSGQVVRLGDRGGSYAARNAGIEAASGDVLAFTDSDCAPRPDWLQHGLEAIEEGAHVAAGRIEVPLEPDPTIAELVHASRYLNQAAYCLAGFAATANLFVRATVFEQVGRFNPRLYSGGDREFCLRAHAAGFAPHYTPQARVVHRARRGIAEVAGKAFRTGVGRAQTVRHGAGPAAEIDRDGGWLREHSPHRLRLRRPSDPWGADRLRAQGYEPSERELIGLNLGGYLLFEPAAGRRLRLRAAEWIGPGALAKGGSAMSEAARSPEVEFQWWRECPSWERALADLREVMEQAGLDPEAIKIHEVVTEDDAERLSFIGSPTIRVDGVDVQTPGPDKSGPSVGLTCRTYRRRDGRVSPLPDPEDVREALRKETEKET